MTVLLVFILIGVIALTSCIIFMWADPKMSQLDLTTHVVVSALSVIVSGICITATWLDLHKAYKDDTCVEKVLTTIDNADGPSKVEETWICTKHKTETKESK